MIRRVAELQKCFLSAYQKCDQSRLQTWTPAKRGKTAGDWNDVGTNQDGVTGKLSEKEKYRGAVEAQTKKRIQTEPQVQSRPRPATIGRQGIYDKELQEYLQIVRERVSSDL